MSFRTRLDGISRNASKFPDPFGVVLAVSVQAERTDKDRVSCTFVLAQPKHDSWSYNFSDSY